MDKLKSNWINILISFVAILLLFVESKSIGDFEIFLQASKDLIDGKNIYEIKYHTWYHYFYDTFFALIIYPLTFLSLYWANFVWLSLNLLFTFRIWKITEFHLPKFSAKHASYFTLLSFLFVFMVWHKNMHLTQMSIFLLYLCLEGIHQIELKNQLKGSLLIGLGISVKILPIVFIPYLIFRKKYLSSILVIGTTALVLILPATIVGWSHNLELVAYRLQLINPLNSEHILDVEEYSFHSITSLLSILLVKETNSILDIQRNIADININTLKHIILASRLVLVSSFIFFLKTWPFQSAKNNLHKWYEWSYLLLIIPLIFPHQQHYAFFFAFPASTYLIWYYHVYYKAENPLLKIEKRVFLSSLILIFILFNSHFLLGEFREIYDHFKTLTYGALLLIPLLAYAKPSKVNQTTASVKANGE